MINRPHAGVTVRELMEQLDIAAGRTPRRARCCSAARSSRGAASCCPPPDYSGQGTISVGSLGGIRWGLTSTLDVLQATSPPARGPARWLAALGYTGWGAGQLDGELTRHGWHSIDGSDELIFDTPLDARWPRAFAALGIDVGHLSATAGRAWARLRRAQRVG